MPDHNFYIQRAIDLAKKGGVQTLSNPNVGAVIVHDSKIIGEGYHTRFGAMHAEREALASVAEHNRIHLPESTLYVTLEPCCIHSKTPPCTDAIIEAGIKSVVIGCRDPHAPMNGKSIDLLKQHGIHVIETTGLKTACEDLIRPFKAHLSKKPYVILKWAQTLDNYIGKRDQQVWLSNAYSKVLTHRWRSEIDAILVGYNTVVADNPQLTTRLVEGKNPYRVILDKEGSLDTTFHVIGDTLPSLIINSNGIEKVDAIKRFKHLDDNDDFIDRLLLFLFEMGVHYLMVEGGTKTINRFIKGKAWDEARIIKVPRELGSGIAAPKLRGRRFKSDFLHSDRIDYVYPL